STESNVGRLRLLSHCGPVHLQTHRSALGLLPKAFPHRPQHHRVCAVREDRAAHALRTMRIRSPMNTKTLRARAKTGSILVTTILFCSLIGVVLVAYLSMVGSQRKAVFRSQIWNECIPMCEAGIEEAMSHLNHNATVNNFAINGWVLSNGAYRKERSLNGGKVKMAIGTDFPPTITV